MGVVTSWTRSSYLNPTMEYPSKDLISIVYLNVKYFNIFETIQIIPRECTYFPALGSDLELFISSYRTAQLFLRFL